MNGFSKFTIASVAMLLASCNATGGSSSFPSTQEHAAAFQTCAGASVGKVSCDVLVRTGGSRNVLGYGPSDLEAAYNLPSSSEGSGQIVAVVDAYNNPNAAADLAAYRTKFGLPAVNLLKYNQTGQQKNYPAGNTAWGLQIDLDIEMVSASCPLCTIYLVEANSSSKSDIQTAEAQAVTLGAHIVSNGFVSTGLSQSYFDTKGVTYLGGAGDSGSGVGQPAAFDSVVAVGATTLSRGGGGTRGWTENVWPGAGGGCTSEPKPRWQHDKRCTFRLADDVSAVGDPNTGVAEYDTYGYGGWLTVGGTAVPTPLLAGVFGLAGNATTQNGGRTFWQTAHHRFLFRLEKGRKSVRYSPSGGWGSPDGVGAF